jgi:hypothetical protein
MVDYLTQFERETGIGIGAWTIKGTTHSTNPHPSRITVPRQIGGDDCGVFICMIGDLLRRKKDVMEADQAHVDFARERLRQCILENRGLELIPTSETADQDIEDAEGQHNVVTMTEDEGNIDDMVIDARSIGTNYEKLGQKETCVNTVRLSRRKTKYKGGYAEPQT